MPDIVSFVVNEMPSGSKIGFDPHLHSAKIIAEMSQKLLPKEISLVVMKENPIDIVRGSAFGPPANPVHKLRIHPHVYAGSTVKEKVKMIRNHLATSPFFVERARHELSQDQEKRGLVLTVLEEVMWTLNIRGQDFDFNQVAIAYALITTSKHIDYSIIWPIY